jgi:hypothetical protein
LPKRLRKAGNEPEQADEASNKRIDGRAAGMRRMSALIFNPVDRPTRQEQNTGLSPRLIHAANGCALM